MGAEHRFDPSILTLSLPSCTSLLSSSLLLPALLSRISSPLSSFFFSSLSLSFFSSLFFLFPCALLVFTVSHPERDSEGPEHWQRSQRVEHFCFVFHIRSLLSFLASSLYLFLLFAAHFLCFWRSFRGHEFLLNTSSICISALVVNQY